MFAEQPVVTDEGGGPFIRLDETGAFFPPGSFRFQNFSAVKVNTRRAYLRPGELVLATFSA